jgi:hypothetical protein
MITARSTAIKLLLGSLLLSGPPLHAEQMWPLSIEHLSAKANLVLQGRVLGKTVHRDPQGRIYTSVRMQVDEVWKGSLATNQFTLVHGGGVLDDEVATVSGQASYEVGEEVVAFLILNPQGEGVSIGLSQGKFHIWKDPRNGDKLAHNRFHGLRPAAASPSPEGATAAKVLDRLTVPDLKRRVQGGAQ